MSERAAVVALTLRRARPWNRLAGAIEEEGSALRLLRALSDEEDPRLFDDSDPRDELAKCEAMLDSWRREGIQVVTVLQDSYPVNLRMVHDRPSLLFVRGELRASDERAAAVVGTRSASAAGLEQARAIAQELAEHDYVVVSGLAVGIDTAAHTAVLDSGGRTLAVVGTGLRGAYPKQNAGLQDRIAREAAVLSPFLPDQGPRKWTFPMRNAVMSGIARATVVIEASHTSGARMQAGLALAHGRPVFLVESLLSHEWAREYAKRPNTYVITSGAEVVSHLERLYAEDYALSA